MTDSILSLEAPDHLAAGLARFHELVRFSDFLKAKNAYRFRFIAACCNIIRDSLKRNIRQRKLGSTENEAAEEAEVNATRHPKQWIEFGDLSKAPEKTRQACTSASAKHGKRIEDGAVAHEIENRVNLLAFGNAG